MGIQRRGQQDGDRARAGKMAPVADYGDCGRCRRTDKETSVDGGNLSGNCHVPLEARGDIADVFGSTAGTGSERSQIHDRRDDGQMTDQSEALKENRIALKEKVAVLEKKELLFQQERAKAQVELEALRHELEKLQNQNSIIIGRNREQNCFLFG